MDAHHRTPLVNVRFLNCAAALRLSSLEQAAQRAIYSTSLTVLTLHVDCALSLSKARSCGAPRGPRATAMLSSKHPAVRPHSFFGFGFARDNLRWSLSTISRSQYSLRHREERQQKAEDRGCAEEGGERMDARTDAAAVQATSGDGRSGVGWQP